MALETEKLLDDIGWRILKELNENARLSFSELGRRVGLSVPAVTERVRRMEDVGVIKGYRVELDPAKIEVPPFRERRGGPLEGRLARTDGGLGDK